MKINRNNYEAYFIDHLDGRLDAALLVELNQFLNANPDLKEELAEFESIDINLQDSFIYTEKEELKKAIILSVGKIDSENYNDYFIAATEGDLSQTEQEELETFLNLNPNLQAAFDLFKVSRLSPDDEIVFSNKSSLKKYPLLLLKTWYKPIGIAASLIVLFGILNILQPTSISSPPTERAEVPSTIKTIKAPSFQLSYQHPSLAHRNYQITHIHSEEIIPIEPLYSMASIKVPIKFLTASLSYPLPSAEMFAYRNEYDVLTKELMIKEEFLLASYGESNPKAREKIEKAFWAKSFGKQKRRKSREEIFGDENKKARVNLWTLASIGIESFNQITGSNINIERKLNKEGEKNKYILVNGNLNSNEVTDSSDKPNL